MRWSARVQPAKIRRLYALESRGIYDESVQELGWQLHARCQDALLVWQAVGQGRVPCPECGELVSRAKCTQRAPESRAVRFACPHCSRRLTCFECREALRDRPQCFECLRPLEWRYAENRLACPGCGRGWSWQGYRRSVSGRLRLPCPHCAQVIRRPDGARRSKGSDAGRRVVLCPKCGSRARHAEGEITCPVCGYRQAWRKYRRQLKRRAERLRCGTCGCEFTWKSWRECYRGQNLLSGKPAPLSGFVGKWERCKTPQQMMAAIDALLHAVHGRGALAPVLIEGGEPEVMALLDELAGRRDAECGALSQGRRN